MQITNNSNLTRSAKAIILLHFVLISSASAGLCRNAVESFLNGHDLLPLKARVSQHVSKTQNVTIIPSENGRNADLEFLWNDRKYRLRIPQTKDSKLADKEIDRLWPPQRFAKVLEASDGTPLVVVEGISQAQLSFYGERSEVYIIKKLSLFEVDLAGQALIPLDSLLRTPEWNAFKYSWMEGKLLIDELYESSPRLTYEIDLKSKRFQKHTVTTPLPVAAHFDISNNSLVPVEDSNFLRSFALSGVLIDEARGGFRVEARTAQNSDHLGTVHNYIALRFLDTDSDLFDLKELTRFFKEENLPFGRFIPRETFHRIQQGELVLLPL